MNTDKHGWKKGRMKTDKTRFKNRDEKSRPVLRLLFSSASICGYLWLILLTSCSSTPTDLRSLIPSESLVYLETNDLGAAIKPILENEAFKKAAKSQPDLSALNGIQLAVAVTGFESKEEKLTDEHSVGSIQPRFVAVADTHAWNWQANAFAEQRLGTFVTEMYQSDVAVEVYDRDGGKYYTWAAQDGRKAFALVVGSIVYFSNDETAIDKCLAVKRGEADNFNKTGKVPQASASTLALGYISTDGVAQIANIIGMRSATDVAEDADIQGAIAGLLPAMIRNSITEVTWEAARAGNGYEDKYQIAATPEIARVLNETLAASGNTDRSLFDLLPGDAASFTLYNLTDPQVAWRSVLLTAQQQTDPLAGRMIAEFSGAFFEPYGVGDAEMFLDGVSGSILTARPDVEGEKAVVIATVAEQEKVNRALLKGFVAAKEQPSATIRLFHLEDGDLSAAFIGNKIVAGDRETVMRCLDATRTGSTYAKNPRLKDVFESKAASITSATDLTWASEVAAVLSEPVQEPVVTTYTIETRFTSKGMGRRTVSDLGFIGSIIAQLAPEQ